MNSDKLKYIFLLILITIFFVLFYGNIPYKQHPYSIWDLNNYIKMANCSPKISTQIERPFTYRILGPYAAGLLPFSIGHSFKILSILTAIALVIVFFLFLRSNGINSFLSFFTVFLFIANRHLFGSNMWNYFQLNDIISQFLIVLFFWAMIKQKFLTMTILLAIGAMTRETWILVGLAFFIFLLEKKMWGKYWKKFLLAIIPASLIFFAIRIFVPYNGGIGLYEAFSTYYTKFFKLEIILRLLAHPFIPLTLFPLIFWKDTVKFFRKNIFALVFILAVLFSTGFGVNNERLMQPVFIIFFWLIAIILQKHFSSNFATDRIFRISILLCALISSLHHTIGYFTLPSRNYTIIMELGSFSIVGIIGIYKLLSEKYSRQIKLT